MPACQVQRPNAGHQRKCSVNLVVNSQMARNQTSHSRCSGGTAAAVAAATSPRKRRGSEERFTQLAALMLSSDSCAML